MVNETESDEETPKKRKNKGSTKRLHRQKIHIWQFERDFISELVQNDSRLLNMNMKSRYSDIIGIEWELLRFRV